LTPRAIATIDGEDEPGPLQSIDRRTLVTGRAALALARFPTGQTDLVLGGRFEHLPLIAAARLGGRDVRGDPAAGLFGLAIVGKGDFLADRSVRDALARAIDRAALARVLNLQGWTAATTPLPAALDMARPPTLPGWEADPMDRRIADARAAIDAWKAANGEAPAVRVALPAGAGATLLFFRLRGDFARIGVTLLQASAKQKPDLRLIDEVAPFDSALWYLAQLDCAGGIACNPDGSVYLDSARSAGSPVEQATFLGEAERAIVGHAGYIALGQPIRWSLVSSRLTGFAPSPRAVHPLNGLTAKPN
jgi:oligopeptide transport system substrate-binding protein